MSATTWAALGWRLFLLTSGIPHSSFHAATFVRFSVVYFHVSRAVAGEGIPESYLPKTCVHQWEGHTKVETLQLSVLILLTYFFLQGVNCIRWLPKWGHLLLSASLDNTVKIWDVYASLPHSLVTLFLLEYSTLASDFSLDAR